MASVKTEFQEFEVGEPHEKNFLTTRLGRKLETLSLGDLLVTALLALIIASEYFYIATPYGHGMDVADTVAWSWSLAGESIYFSTITFTTLGYGDISPIGLGRLMAMLLVVGGLTIVSLAIGKIASERQQAYLLLLHTSDCQRRISGYIDDLDDYVCKLNYSMASNDPALAKVKLKELKPLVEAISNYVAFHSFQSNLIEFGNDTAITRLLGKMEEVAQSLSDIFKTRNFGEPIGSRSLALCRRIAALEALVIRFQEKKIRELQTGIGWRFSFHRYFAALGLAENIDTSKIAKRACLLFNMNKALHDWSDCNQSEWLLERVISLLPEEPRTLWAPHQHKRIAQKLNISNKLASACISTLIQRNVC